MSGGRGRSSGTAPLSVCGVDTSTHHAGSPPRLPAQWRGKESGQKLRAVGAGQALGTLHMAPVFQGLCTPPRKAVDRARLGSMFPEGRAGARVARGLLRKATVNSQADVRVG